MLLFVFVSPFCVDAWFSFTCGFLVRDTLRGLGIFTDKILYGSVLPKFAYIERNWSGLALK
jgi:hypothetical protein